jgi:hypothetical protein
VAPVHHRYARWPILQQSHISVNPGEAGIPLALICTILAHAGDEEMRREFQIRAG